MDASRWFYSVFSEQGLYFGVICQMFPFMMLDFTFFVFIHENIIFAQCLFVNVNLFLYCLVFPLCVCVRESVCDIWERARASVCMHAHTFPLWSCVSTSVSSLQVTFLVGEKKNIVVALSQVCGYI